jgi:hypothetical protein
MCRISLDSADVTPCYLMLAGWGLALLLVFGASIAWTVPIAKNGSRVLFTLAGAITLLYGLLMVYGDAVVLRNKCAPGEMPANGTTCYPGDWVRWDAGQLPLHVLACVLLVAVLWTASVTWRQMQALDADD